MDRDDLERKLPTMSHIQLIDTVKACLDMIERLEGELAAGARKLYTDLETAPSPSPTPPSPPS